MNEQSVRQQAFAESSILQPMRASCVPQIDSRYWTMMSMASIFGCNLGDDCSYYAGWNHWIGLGPLALIFSALLLGERQSTRETQAWYWTAVIVLRTAATNLADLATHTFDLPYIKVIFGLAVLQIVVIWRVAPRLLVADRDPSGRPATDGWYWLSLLTAGTLGTALGDWVAEELHVITGYGTLLLGAAFGLVVASGRRGRWRSKAAYWTAVIAVRAAGTTAGDWLAFREDPGLLNGPSSRLAVEYRTLRRFVPGMLLRMESTNKARADEAACRLASFGKVIRQSERTWM